ncbi:sugar ABC transporter permease [Saxibacter everestensis]|uniref:Sugar ABC transporter permease n=1 Tax=Saxibacter everestensis TaxID=2909229 RepID=A0ABY8QV10_9MICO|nr:sugar ABC transporter permease [Brevibacteriaceae bacterium ZFBP1038]
MNAILSSAPALILIGAIAIPILVFAVLGTGEKIIEQLRPRSARKVRPWFWLLLPLALITLILIYPMIDTVVSAFRSSDGSAWVGLQNFAWAFAGSMLGVLGNNVIWLIVFPLGTLVLALIVAVLFDKVRYERFAMTLVVLPTAISFTAGSIIWRQVYDYKAAGSQTGLLNALWTLIPGNQPVPWLQTEVVNTLCLIIVAVWSSLGVAALILSAAVKNMPSELVEAARLDGANEWRIFFSVTLAHITPTLLVVATTEVIFALKIFDIVYVMTNGNFNTDTIANRMYFELFSARDLGHASAIAVILLIVAIPVVVVNIRQFRAEEGH